MQMNRMLSRSGIVLAGLTLTACAGIQPVKPGPFIVDGDYKVTVGETWTAYPKDRRTQLRTLTIDGKALNSLSFAASLDDGHMLIHTYARDKLIPRYRSDMTMTEIVAFVRDSLSVGGMNDAQLLAVRPERFGTLDGVRFDIGGATQRGLTMSGTGKAAKEDGKLHLIVYTAPSEYYFSLHEEEVEAILDSVTLQ